MPHCQLVSTVKPQLEPILLVFDSVTMGEIAVIFMRYRGFDLPYPIVLIQLFSASPTNSFICVYGVTELDRMRQTTQQLLQR